MPRTQMTLHLPNDLMAWLDEYAVSQKITRTALIISLLEGVRSRRLGEADRIQTFEPDGNGGHKRIPLEF